MNKKLFLLLVFQFSVVASSSEIMKLEDIKNCINNCTTCDCQDFSENKWDFQESMTESQYNEFLDAMYSLEYRESTLREDDAILLFNQIANKVPFSSPQLLGEW